jgi:hypothetical protein
VKDSTEKLPTLFQAVSDRLMASLADKSEANFQLKIFKALSEPILMIAKTVDAARELRLALEARIDELEKQLSDNKHKAVDRIRYRGIWREDMFASIGDIVTDKGTLWHCEADTESRPGVDGSWRMMVKTQR